MKDRELMDKIAQLNTEQRNIIEKEIQLLLYEDREQPSKLTELKHKAYKMYAENIASLISKMEVYFHDLPAWIYGFIEFVFRLFSFAAVATEKEAVELYQTAIDYEGFLIYCINLKLIDYYFREIKQYKKIIIRFKHHGIKTDNGTPILVALNACLKEVSKQKKNCQKVFKECYDFNKRTTLLRFKRDDIKNLDISELAECVKKAENGVELCEQFFPAIIDNGFVSTRRARFVYKLPSIITFLLAIAGIIVFILKKIG